MKQILNKVFKYKFGRPCCLKNLIIYLAHAFGFKLCKKIQPYLLPTTTQTFFLSYHISSHCLLLTFDIDPLWERENELLCSNIGFSLFLFRHVSDAFKPWLLLLCLFLSCFLSFFSSFPMFTERECVCVYASVCVREIERENN